MVGPDTVAEIRARVPDLQSRRSKPARDAPEVGAGPHWHPRRGAQRLSGGAQLAEPRPHQRVIVVSREEDDLTARPERLPHRVQHGPGLAHGFGGATLGELDRVAKQHESIGGLERCAEPIQCRGPPKNIPAAPRPEVQV